MAITYETKSGDSGGLLINIPNWTSSPFGNIKIWDQSNRVFYEHDFGSGSEASLLIKIPLSDVGGSSYLRKLNVNIDSEEENVTYTFNLDDNSSINNLLNLYSGNWLYFYCPITW